MKPGIDDIRARLEAAFPGARIDVVDDSHAHVGHEGAKGGAGHFTVHLVSPAFAGLRTVARHRLVYDCVHDWMPQRIHALAIHARTPEEVTD